MKKFAFVFTLVIILLLGSFIYWKYSFTYSEGYRAGLLQKVSLKGTFFKTYEGEIILSSIESRANVAIASEKFYLSVVDKEVALQIEKIQGGSVIVHYREKNGVLPWRGESTYLVDSVKVNVNTGGGFR